MGLPVQTELIVYRFVLSELLPDVGDLDLQVEVLELEGVEVELALLRLDLLLGDGLPEEFSRVHELLQEVASEFPQDLDTFGIDVGQIMLSGLFLLLFTTLHFLLSGFVLGPTSTAASL